VTTILQRGVFASFKCDLWLNLSKKIISFLFFAIKTINLLSENTHLNMVMLKNYEAKERDIRIFVVFLQKF